jgi:hypothetical protein
VHYVLRTAYCVLHIAQKNEIALEVDFGLWLLRSQPPRISYLAVVLG